MPELPEVEHAARLIRKWMRGRRVVKVVVPKTRVVRGTSVRAIEALRGAKLVEIARTGKFLRLAFDEDRGLLVHLGMSGYFTRTRPGEATPGHVRLALQLDDGSVVSFSDPRMFGRVAARRASELAGLPEVVRHGPDALRELDANVLGARLGRTSRAIKVALMDPSVIAGIGNIQATEALWRAKLDPRRAAWSLEPKEVRALVRAIARSLEATLATMTTDELRYVSAGGDNPFVVYDRAGAPCPRCRTRLEKITQAARTTTFCPRCQGVGGAGTQTRGGRAQWVPAKPGRATQR